MIKYATYTSNSRTPDFVREAKSFRHFCQEAPFGPSMPYGAKNEAPMFSAVEYSEAGLTIQAVTVAMFDLDAISNASLAFISQALREARINHCLRSTWSDMPHSRCVRLAVELSRPALSEEWDGVWDTINTKYLDGRADPGCADITRKWYAPSHPQPTGLAAVASTFFDGAPFVLPEKSAVEPAAPPSETKSLVVLSGPEGVQIRLDGRAIDIPKGGLAAFADLMCRLAELPPCHGQLEFTLRRTAGHAYDTYPE